MQPERAKGVLEMMFVHLIDGVVEEVDDEISQIAEVADGALFLRDRDGNIRVIYPSAQWKKAVWTPDDER